MKLNRTLLSAAAVCALAAAGSAQAQSSVTLYGIIGVNAVHATNVADGGEYRLEDERLNPSRIGFKGQEDLGNGTFAIFDLESPINPDSGSTGMGGTTWGRGAYVGLKGGFGTLTAGRHWNINDDILGNFFIFGGYAVFNYTGFGYTSDLLNNSVKYVSPSFGGLTVEGLVAAGEGKGPKATEVGAMYVGGPVKAGVTYHKAENPGGATNKLTSGGVAVAVGSFNIRGGYSSAKNEYDDYSGALGTYKAVVYDVGVDYTVGAVGLSLDYVKRDLKSSGDDTNFIRLLGTYALSKRTSLVGNLITLKNKGAATESFYSIKGPGEKQNVIGLGITHSF